MKKRIAILGCGRISKNHVIAIANNFKDAELIALCDLDIEKANLRKQEYSELMKKESFTSNIKTYTDFKQMIKSSEIDIVAIATESGYHYEHTMYMLANEIHVLVEKPMALNKNHALEMIDLAKEKKLNLGVCFQNRFNPPIQELKRVIEEGKFGKIYAITANIFWNRNKSYYEKAPWRGTHALDGGALMNQCIHNIDLLQWVANSKPIAINAMLANYNHEYLEVEDYGSIQVRFDNGIIGNIQGTVSVYPKNFKETLTVFGEKGTVEIGGLAVNEIEHWEFENENKNDLQKLNTKGITNVYGDGHTPLYTDFILAVNKRKKPYIHGEEGLKALEIVLKAYGIDGVNYEKD